MKNVAPHDRPREKLERLGPAGLGDNELLALVLGGGVRGQGALDLANRLIEFAGGLHGLTRIAVSELRAVRGVGRARAAQVIAAVAGRGPVGRGVGAGVGLGPNVGAVAAVAGRRVAGIDGGHAQELARAARRLREAAGQAIAARAVFVAVPGRRRGA